MGRPEKRFNNLPTVAIAGDREQWEAWLRKRGQEPGDDRAPNFVEEVGQVPDVPFLRVYLVGDWWESPLVAHFDGLQQEAKAELVPEATSAPRRLDGMLKG